MVESRARKGNQIVLIPAIEPLIWESLDLPKRAEVASLGGFVASLRGFVEATAAHRRSMGILLL